MRWRNAVASMALLMLFATESFAAERFACAEYFAATSAGQKKSEPGIKGTLVFDQDLKSVQFLDRNGTSVFAVKYDAINVMQYEKTTQPRYVAAVLVSPAFLLTRSKKHYLTIRYNGPSEETHSVIVRLSKWNAREVVAAAAQTSKTVEQIEAE